jgi:hypothetical protein
VKARTSAEKTPTLREHGDRRMRTSRSIARSTGEAGNEGVAGWLADW